MNRLIQRNFLIPLAGLLLALFSVSHSHAAGLMSPTNQALGDLEIREHHVDVVIEDGYAITRVEQIFFNPHSEDLEARYSFPIPAKAAVAEFTYWIDGQAVTGEVVEKERARKIYQEEKSAGREVAVTEQDAFKTFDISVYPVRTQQDVKIRLSYIQAVHVDTAIGRYVYPLENGGVDEEKLSFWTYNDEVTEKFSFTLLFRSSYPVDTFYLPKHPNALTQQLSANEWQVSFASNNSESNTSANLNQDVDKTQPQVTTKNVGNGVRLDTDIVVYWRHQAGLPGSVDLVSYRENDKDRGTFMLTITPGDDLAPITEGSDWIFVLDYSGSMQGKYQSMINGVKKGLSRLNSNDRFRIFTFSSRAQEITSNFVSATPDSVKRAIAELEKHQPNGSTNLYEGIDMGTKALDSDRSSAIILVTDGVANVGITEKKRFLSLMEKHDVRLFTFVMGNSANRPLLEGMVNVSNGFAINISNSDDIGGKLLEASSKMTHQALHDVKVEFSGVKVTDLSPQKIGSLYRGQQLIVFGHYWGDEDKLRKNAGLTVKGKISGQQMQYTTKFNFPADDNSHPEIERLWAYAAIEDLTKKMDYFGSHADTEQAITDIAIENGLVTNYTSMLVLREEEFQNRGIKQSNKARLDKEKQAQVERKQQPERDNRVDQQAPMYQKPAPTHNGGGGGGSTSPLAILVLLPLTLIPALRKRRQA